MDFKLKRQLLTALGEEHNSRKAEQRITDLERLPRVPNAALMLARNFKHARAFWFWLTLEFFPRSYYAVDDLVLLANVPQSHRRRWTDIEREHLDPALDEIEAATGERYTYTKYLVAATGTAQRVDGIEIQRIGRRLFDGYSEGDNMTLTAEKATATAEGIPIEETHDPTTANEQTAAHDSQSEGTAVKDEAQKVKLTDRLKKLFG